MRADAPRVPTALRHTPNPSAPVALWELAQRKAIDLESETDRSVSNRLPILGPSGRVLELLV
jgi:hypothetical protein